MTLGNAAFTASYILLWVVVVVQALILVEVLRQIGILRRRMPPESGALLIDEGLPRGATAPPINARDLQSGSQFTDSDLHGRTTLLVFVAPNCAGCHALAPDLRRFTEDYADRVRVVAVCPGAADSCAEFAHRYKLEFPFLLDEDQRISQAFQVRRTPSATLIDADGRVRIHGIVNNLHHLEGLLNEEGTPIAGRTWELVEEKEVSTFSAS